MAIDEQLTYFVGDGDSVRSTVIGDVRNWRSGWIRSSIDSRLVVRCWRRVKCSAQQFFVDKRDKIEQIRHVRFFGGCDRDLRLHDEFSSSESDKTITFDGWDFSALSSSSSSSSDQRLRRCRLLRSFSNRIAIWDLIGDARCLRFSRYSKHRTRIRKRKTYFVAFFHWSFLKLLLNSNSRKFVH